MRWLDTRWTVPLLFILEFLDTTLVNFVIEAPLAAIMLAHRRRIPLYFAVVLVSTLIGSALMYWIGGHASDSLANWLPWLSQQEFQETQADFRQRGLPFIILGGVGPLPWQIVTLSAGAAGYSFWLFMLGVLIGRGLRFAIIAVAIYWWGDEALELWRRLPKRGKRAVLAALLILIVVWLYLTFRG